MLAMLALEHRHWHWHWMRKKTMLCMINLWKAKQLLVTGNAAYSTCRCYSTYVEALVKYWHNWPEYAHILLQSSNILLRMHETYLLGVPQTQRQQNCIKQLLAVICIQGLTLHHGQSLLSHRVMPQVPQTCVEDPKEGMVLDLLQNKCCSCPEMNVAPLAEVFG